MRRVLEVRTLRLFPPPRTERLVELPGQQGRGGRGALRLEPLAPEAGALARRPDDPATERERGEGSCPLTPRTAGAAFPFMSLPMGLRLAKLGENRAGTGE